jgi:CRP-like cAMP-binding protein
VLLEEVAGPGDDAPSAPPLLLGRRVAGDIVGEQGVIVDDKGAFVRIAQPDTPRSSVPVGPSDVEPPTSSAEARWLTPMLARKFAKRWVGRRRTVSVRAVTDVTTVVMKRADMGWVMNLGLPERADTVSFAVIAALDRIEAHCEEREA